MFLLQVKFTVLYVRDGPSSELNAVSSKDDLWNLSLAIVEAGDWFSLKRREGSCWVHLVMDKLPAKRNMYCRLLERERGVGRSLCHVETTVKC